MAFQSTPPVWVVTGLFRSKAPLCLISIHTTRVGGDGELQQHMKMQENISIHTTRVGGDSKI